MDICNCRQLRALVGNGKVEHDRSSVCSFSEIPVGRDTEIRAREAGNGEAGNGALFFRRRRKLESRFARNKKIKQ